MTGHPRSRVVTADDGFTMVELIVYSAVTVLVATMLASIFLSAWQADATTRDRESATAAAHTFTTSIQTSIRNSSGFHFDGTLLQARVSKGASAWECRAWRLANPRVIGGQTWYELQYNRGNAAITNASPGWKALVGEGEPQRPLVQGSPTPDKPFGGYANLLTFNLKILIVDLAQPSLDGASVEVRGEALAQAKGGTSPTCW